MCWNILFRNLNSKHIDCQNNTNLSAILVDPHATILSAEFSAKRDSWELPGLVSALRGRVATIDAWFGANNPEADDGREFGPHALEAASWDLSLPAVDGRVPLPPDDGRPLMWLGEQALASVLGDNRVDELHALGAAEDDRLPQVSVPLT